MRLRAARPAARRRGGRFRLRRSQRFLRHVGAAAALLRRAAVDLDAAALSTIVQFVLSAARSAPRYFRPRSSIDERHFDTTASRRCSSSINARELCRRMRRRSSDGAGRHLMTSKKATPIVKNENSQSSLSLLVEARGGRLARLSARGAENASATYAEHGDGGDGREAAV